MLTLSSAVFWAHPSFPPEREVTVFTRDARVRSHAKFVAVALATAGLVAASVGLTPSPAHAAPPVVAISISGAQNQSWTVPAGVTSITVSVAGAAGGDGGTLYGGYRGSGTVISATIAVTPGDIITAVSSARGGDGGATPGLGGTRFAKGGDGGSRGVSSLLAGSGGGGGGSSALLVNGILRVHSAGGGGGGGGIVVSNIAQPQFDVAGGSEGSVLVMYFQPQASISASDTTLYLTETGTIPVTVSLPNGTTPTGTITATIDGFDRAYAVSGSSVSIPIAAQFTERTIPVTLTYTPASSFEPVTTTVNVTVKRHPLTFGIEAPPVYTGQSTTVSVSLKGYGAPLDGVLTIGSVSGYRDMSYGRIALASAERPLGTHTETVSFKPQDYPVTYTAEYTVTVRSQKPTITWSSDPTVYVGDTIEIGKSFDTELDRSNAVLSGDFTLNGAPYGNYSVAANVALPHTMQRITVAPTAAGAYVLSTSNTYAGEQFTSSHTFTAVQVPTAVTLNPIGSSYAGRVTLVSASVNADDARAADGSVEFFVDGASAGTAPVANGVASVSIVLPEGSAAITATFTPTDTARYESSTSGTTTLATDLAPTHIDWVSLPALMRTGVPIDLTASVTSALTNDSESPSGTVQVLVSGASTDTVSMSPNGDGTYSGTFTPSADGDYDFAIAYSGDAAFAGGTTDTVNRTSSPYQVALTGSLDPADGALKRGGALTLTVDAVVASDGALSRAIPFAATLAQAPVVTGDVQLVVDGADHGSPQPLVGGSVALTVPTDLTAGDHTVTARYLPPANGTFAAAELTPFTFTVAATPKPEPETPDGTGSTGGNKPVAQAGAQLPNTGAPGHDGTLLLALLLVLTGVGLHVTRKRADA